MAKKLTKEEAQAILEVFSALTLPTSDDDFLKKATVIDAVKRKMKLQIESEVAKV